MTCLYIYRLTDDTGFAPCVENDLLSLACCKGGQIRNGKVINTGLRHRIGIQREADYTIDEVYILGIYKSKMLYLAKVTNVVTMEEYFDGMSKGRTDDIYSLVNGELVRNKKLMDKNVHTEPDRIRKDIAGQYVVLSNDYVYLGSDAVSIEGIAKYYPHFQETKKYFGKQAQEIVAECRKYQDGKKHIPTTPVYKRGGCK
jgi:hypothetical protein